MMFKLFTALANVASALTRFAASVDEANAILRDRLALDDHQPEVVAIAPPADEPANGRSRKAVKA
jgi:hypothetical protein